MSKCIIFQFRNRLPDYKSGCVQSGNIAGDYYGGDKVVACRWIDGVRTDLDVPVGVTRAYGYSIAVAEK